MRNVVCAHCQATVPAPDEPAEAHCMRCGQPLTPADTRMTAELAAPTGVSPATPRKQDPEPARKYADWDDFRSNSVAVQNELVKFATRRLPDLRRAEVDPLPDRAFHDADQSDAAVASFRVSGDNALVIYGIKAGLPLLGVLFALFAFAVFQERERPGRPDKFQSVFLCVSLSATAFLLAIPVAFKLKPNWPATYWILEGGIFWRQGSSSGFCPWEDLPLLEISQETGKVRAWLRVPSGKRIAIAPPIRNSTELVEYIQAKATAAQFLLRLQRIFDGHTEKFGIVRLNRGGFSAPLFFAPWPEIMNVAADPYWLFVQCLNQPTWEQFRYHDVSFAQLVLAISRILIEEESHLADVARD